MSVFSLVALLILLFLIFKIFGFRREIRYWKKTIQHFQELPAFDPNLIDCYVKFVGRIETENQFKTPLTQMSCAFYIYRVIAHWKAKRKKPDKGMEEQRKIVFEDKSSVTELEMVNDQGRIYVNIQNLATKGEVSLRRRESTSRNCPEICRDKINQKYQQYQLLEIWCNHGDEVIVYGKLVTEAGHLSIVPTGFLEFPSLLVIGNTKDRIRDLTYHFEQKIIELRRIVVIFSFAIVLLLVGVVLY